MTYLELTEVKEELNNRGIMYVEHRNEHGGIHLYIDGLMQIENPTREQRCDFWPYVRVSLPQGDSGYYIRACGVIYDNQSLEQVLGHIYRWVGECIKCAINDAPKKANREEMMKLIEEKLGHSCDHLTSDQKKSQITKLYNTFQRRGLYSMEAIRDAGDLSRAKGLNGKLAKTVIANIRGEYDEREEIADRLCAIDRDINRLIKEKEALWERIEVLGQ